MNKYQEALEWYAEHTSFNQFNIDEAQWADETLQELVDKETPMKRTITNGRPYCPKCSYSLLIQDVWEMIYCCACGQKIDWSDEE